MEIVEPAPGECIMYHDMCPVFSGQIELYTHLPVMRQLAEHLQRWEFRVCGVFLVDSQFMVESFKVMAVHFVQTHLIYHSEAGG